MTLYCWKRKPFFLHLLLYLLNNNHDINTNGCWRAYIVHYICFSKTTVVMCPLTFLVNKQELTTLPLDSTTVLQVFMKLACLFSQAVGLFIGEFVGLYIVLWGVITHESPQGEPDTQQMGSQAVTQTAAHKREKSWGRAPPCGSWNTF